MLPFARILEYGNIAPTKASVKTMNSSNVHIGILMDNGNLYVRGTNSNGQLGNGTTTDITDRWYLTLDSVLQMWCGVQSTLAIKTDGTVWYCGANKIRYPFSGNITTWENITSLFVGLNPLNITKCMLTNFCILFHDIQNNLYGLGRNINYILGTGSTSTEFSTTTLISTDVVKVHTGGDSALYIKNNILYACGTNASNTLGNGGQPYTTYTNINSVFSVGTVLALDIQLGNTGSLVLVDLGGASYLYGTGSNNQGALGNGATTGTTFTYSNSGYSTWTNKIRSLGLYSGSGQYISYILGLDGKYYNAGYNTFGTLGRIGDGAVLMESTISTVENFDNINIRSICYMNYSCQFMLYQNDLYITGNTAILGNGVNINAYQKIALPE